MRKLGLYCVTLMMGVTGIFIPRNSAVCQETSVIMPDSVFTGDILHADAGTDFIAVVYARNGGIYYNRIGYDGTWAEEDSLGAGTEARMDIDVNDHVHVVFVSAGKIAYLMFDGSVWSEITYIESNNGGTCSKPDIVADDNGIAHITYTDSMGNTHWYQNKPDIMYATNVSGSFTDTLIFDGYYENLGGADYIGDYFNKGSYIALDADGNYYVAAHKYAYIKNMSYIDRYYSIVVVSDNAKGNTAVTTSDVYTINDLDFDGTSVFALYKESTFKLSELSVSSPVINFINTQDIAATSVSTLAADGTYLVTGGKNNTNLFTMLGDFSNVYTNLLVKGTTVPVVALNGLYYALYTDNADNKIRIQLVAGPLSFTSFELAEQTGPAIINPVEKTVSVEVATGTSPDNLIAAFLTTTDVVSVKTGETDQVSGVTPNDFSDTVRYTLTAGDATDMTWQVIVSVEPATYSIEGSPSPLEGGTISGTGDYLEGTTAVVTAAAGEGYAFVTWTEDGAEVSTDEEYSFTVTGNRTLTANFIELYSLTVNITGSGSVNVDGTPYSEVVTVKSGTMLDLEAVAGDEYHFEGWTGDLVSANAADSILMDSDKTVTAGFSINQYSLTINVTGSGSVNVGGTPYSEVVTVNSGTMLHLEAVAGDEYHFGGWTGDLVSASASDSILMNGDMTIAAGFSINQYSLTINVTGSGSVNVGGTPYSEAIIVNSGTELSLEAVAGDGYHFEAWGGDLVSSDNPSTVVMSADHSITVTFVAVSSLDDMTPDNVEVYPNPFCHGIHIRTESDVDRVTITKMSGQLVMDMTMNGETFISASHLPEGIYLVNIQLLNGGHITRMITKQ